MDDELPAWAAEAASSEQLSDLHAQEMLRRLISGSRCGNFAGVNFDLRDPRLPSSSKWHSPNGGRPYGMAFPWDRDLCEGDEGRAGQYVTGGREGEVAIQVYPGDTVRVHNVEPFHRYAGSAYDDESDYLEYWVSLSAHKPDGQYYISHRAISLVSRDGVSPYHELTIESVTDDYRDFMWDHLLTWDKICHRIDRYEAEGSPQGAEWISLAAWLRDEVQELQSAIDKGLPTTGGGNIPFYISDLIEAASAAGYALARSEAYARLIPLAQKGVRAQKSQLAATARASERADPVRAFAAADIRDHPNTSQTACAARVAARLQRDQRSVERVIQSLFEWRDLPGGGREKRPKRIPKPGRG